jgi:starvation-inducible DNA-binding protein
MSEFKPAGVDAATADKTCALLQHRLNALIDLELTLKHVHWNVVGPNFIGVHEMLDPQVDHVREMVDDVAERIAALGGVPRGTPGAVVNGRSWNDYEIGRDTAISHLGALDVVFNGVIKDHRSVIEELEGVEPITQDMIIAQTGILEQDQWFVRAHLESSSGHLSTEDVSTEKRAAQVAG